MILQRGSPDDADLQHPPNRPRHQAGSGGGQHLGDSRPLLLEELAQSILGVREGHPRDNRLQEAQHDELARGLAVDAAAHQVEDLRFVDRTGRARVGRPADVRLIDLEAWDRDRARLAVEQHGELTKEAVGAASRALDLDEALDIAARPAQEDALAEEIAGRVLPDVAGVAGQVEQLAARSEADLHLVDARSAALEAV